MTQPLAHDYPDWGRSGSAADIKVMRADAVVINALTTYGPFFVGNYRHLELFMAGVGARTLMRLIWWADQALTENMGNDRIHVAAGGQADFHVPIGGPWLTVEVSGQGYPVTVSPQVYMSMVPRANFLDAIGYAPMLISQTAVAVAAAGSVAFNATSTLPGLATWAIDTDAAAWKARLQVTDITGSLIRIATARNGLYGGPALVHLPAAPARIVFDNLTGVAVTCDLTLISRSVEGA